ncbi:MAG: hypothetical protein V1849_01785 [Chloroflexota bacterium]
MPLRVGESLLGMMLSCVDNRAVLEVRRGGNTQMVEIRHRR